MVDGLGRWRTSNTETEDAAQRQLPTAEDEHGLCSVLSLVLSLSLSLSLLPSLPASLWNVVVLER